MVLDKQDAFVDEVNRIDQTHAIDEKGFLID